MAFGDLTRINTNLQSMGALRTLQNTNNKLGVRQMRLATGSRLNRAEDDSASYSIAKKLEAKVKGQGQALSNIGDAKGMLTVAEGSLNTTMDILQTMKEKAVQAANDTMGTTERDAIQSELTELQAEIDDTIGDTTYNGTSLFTSTALTFQVNAENGDNFAVTVGTVSTDSSSLDVAVTSTSVNSAANAGSFISQVDAAIQTVADKLGDLGDKQKRLSIKQDNLSLSINNYEASRSRIADADFAKEQMEIVKLQILQQTGTSALAQGNSAPQSVMSLF